MGDQSADHRVQALMTPARINAKRIKHQIRRNLLKNYFANPGPACDALLETIRDPSNDVRIATIRAPDIEMRSKF